MGRGIPSIEMKSLSMQKERKIQEEMNRKMCVGRNANAELGGQISSAAAATSRLERARGTGTSIEDVRDIADAQGEQGVHEATPKMTLAAPRSEDGAQRGLSG
jgi:hypothetical protein